MKMNGGISSIYVFKKAHGLCIQQYYPRTEGRGNGLRVCVQ